MENLKEKFIKQGYIAKRRSGKCSQVFKIANDELCFSYGNGMHGGYDSVSNDLRHCSNSGYDIMEVYGLPKHAMYVHNINTEGRELLWKREEVKEMTVEQIEKELGYTIKVIK